MKGAVYCLKLLSARSFLHVTTFFQRKHFRLSQLEGRYVHDGLYAQSLHPHEVRRGDQHEDVWRREAGSRYSATSQNFGAGTSENDFFILFLMLLSSYPFNKEVELFLNSYVHS